MSQIRAELLSVAVYLAAPIVVVGNMQFVSIYYTVSCLAPHTL